MTSIIKDVYIKKTNSVKRDRYCSCGFLFSTFEKFIKSSKSKKERPATKWKDFRVIWYGTARYNSAIKAKKKAFQKLGLKRIKVFQNKNQGLLFHAYEGLGNNLAQKKFSDKKKFFEHYEKLKYEKNYEPVVIYNKQGKAWISINIDDKKKINTKIESKKKTIINILKNPYYWLVKEYFYSF
jgi:hypothetical protein